MRRFSVFLVVFGILVMASVALLATAQDGPPGRPGGGGPGGASRREGPGGPGGPGGPVSGFHLIPRFAVEQLNLTADQQEQIAELEKETKAKLYKILTSAQQKTLEEARPPQGGPGGVGGFGGGQRKPSGAPGGKPSGKPGRKPSGDSDGAGPGGEKPTRTQRPASE